jgi:FAD/FMN-containing dehydrogenase
MGILATWLSFNVVNAIQTFNYFSGHYAEDPLTIFHTCIGNLKLTIIYPSMKNYSQHSTGQNVAEATFPKAIFIPDDCYTQVPIVTKCAFAAGFKVIPRSGGHNYIGISSVTGIFKA